MENATFGMFANIWLGQIQKSVSKNTHAIYKGYVKNYILPYFEDGTQTVETVNRNIDSYIEKIEKNERAELVKKFYPVFSMILDYAVEQGYINFNYAKVKAPFAKDEGLSYSDVGIDELAAILSQANHDDMLLDFILILDCGLSRGEILGLQWGDIDFESKKLRIGRMVVERSGAKHIAEADEKREVPMMDITVDLLAKKHGGAEDFLIPSPSSATTPFTPSSYRKKVDGVIKKALNGDSITIELVGFVLAIIKDHIENIAQAGIIDRSEVLALALEKAKDYTAVELKYRKAGTGYVKQLGPNCWQGRYTPTVAGKRVSHNVYAKTKAECEEKLAELIKKVKSLTTKESV